MSGLSIIIVGIGEDGLDGLAPAARKVVDAAEVLVGGIRHLSKVEGSKAERIDWKDGFEAAFDQIEKMSGKRVVVLASGDPLNFGIGANIIRRFGIGAVTVLPAPGAFSLAAARMGWPLADVECLTIHGRKAEAINLYLTPGRKLLILSWDGTTPAKVAQLLKSRGFGPSRMTVLSHMGGGNEERVDAAAGAWPEGALPDLNVIAIDCDAESGADRSAWPRVPGLPEDAYEHDGLITKRDVRAVTLARLMPMPGQVLWDVGAGSGAIGIEWLRAVPDSTAIAIERDPGRSAVIARNAARLGVPTLTIVEGEAPGVFDGLTPPDAVFLGGGVSVAGLLEACWQALSPGGRLVANTVTLEAEQRLLSFRNEFGGDLARLAVAHAAAVGRMQAFRPLKDVIQLTAVKT